MISLCSLNKILTLKTPRMLKWIELFKGLIDKKKIQECVHHLRERERESLNRMRIGRDHWIASSDAIDDSDSSEEEKIKAIKSWLLDLRWSTKISPCHCMKIDRCVTGTIQILEMTPHVHGSPLATFNPNRYNSLDEWSILINTYTTKLTYNQNRPCTHPHLIEN